MFQSTHSRRVRPWSATSVCCVWCFNPRTHEECDGNVRWVYRQDDVSIHALTKSATPSSFPLIHSCRFQSTHSRRVRHGSPSLFNSDQLFQSTHSRRVRLYLVFGLLLSTFVSIHALTKSATFLSLQLVVFCSFNPRTHEECDPVFFSFDPFLQVSIHALTKSATLRPVCLYKCIAVSIHALTKSATLSCLLPVRWYCSFNPRTHEECDLVGVRIVLQLCSFQSTHSRRVRPRRRLIKKPRPGFNPRTHEECDYSSPLLV